MSVKRSLTYCFELLADTTHCNLRHNRADPYMILFLLFDVTDSVCIVMPVSANDLGTVLGYSKFSNK